MGPPPVEFDVLIIKKTADIPIKKNIAALCKQRKEAGRPVNYCEKLLVTAKGKALGIKTRCVPRTLSGVF